MASPTERIRGFDGLRALAFFGVFVSHQYDGPATGPYGAAGVWLFFVLSGFLITRILAESRTAIEAGTVSFWRGLGDFYTRRTLRIVPVYYLYLAFMTLLSMRWLVSMGTPDRQISCWLFFYNIYVEHHGWGNAVDLVWSLAVEEQFYLLFAPLALLTPRRWLWLPCSALLAVSVAAHTVLADRVGPILPTFDVNSLINFGLLAIGGLAGLVADRPLPRWLTSELAIGVAFALVVLLPAMIPSMHDLFLFGRAMGLVAGLLLIQIYQNQKAGVVALLHWAPLRELGIVSYGAYLFQVLGKSEEILTWLGHSGTPKPVIFLLNLAITLVIARLSWRYFERPILAFGKSGRFRRLSPAAG